MGLTVLQVHGLVMLLAWALLAPIGMFLGRYKFFTGWLYAHMVCQGSALLLVIAGVILATKLTNNYDGESESFLNAHHNIGYVVLAFMLFQAVVAAFRPHKKHAAAATANSAAVADPALQEDGMAVARPANGTHTATTTTPAKHAPEKQGLIRRVWEWQHGLLAVALFFLAFWNLHSGISSAGDAQFDNAWQWVTLAMFVLFLSLFVVCEVVYRVVPHTRKTDVV